MLEVQAMPKSPVAVSTSVVVFALVILACPALPAFGQSAPQGKPAAALVLPKIDRVPCSRFADVPGRVVRSIPKYDPESQDSFQVDLRRSDLSALNLTSTDSGLAYADFDTLTIWPPARRMPADFDPKKVMELGKNPGLGVRGLHARGITGRGVSIAIVDMPPVVDHVEYADRLRLYEEINIPPDSCASMHGAAVASIAVGRTVGVAPEANLFFVATVAVDPDEMKAVTDRRQIRRNFTYYARAVRRVIEINSQLPDGQKIRAISLSVGWSPGEKAFEEISAATRAAKEAGLLVTSSSIEETHNVGIHGLGRDPMADPDSFESWGPGLWWAKVFEKQGVSGRLLIPMDSRTTASYTGDSDYAFYRSGGWSWITPYLAGVYALACQVKPGITPDEFLKLAMDTGRFTRVAQGRGQVSFGPIIDPVAIVDRLKERAVLESAREPAAPK